MSQYERDLCKTHGNTEASHHEAARVDPGWEDPKENRARIGRKVEGVMLERKISKKLKGKVLRTCVTSACLYGLETVALTEQQQKLQVCENNWVRRITRTKRVDRRRMNDLRKEFVMQCSLTGRLVRSRMRWASHLVRMDAGKLAKRADVENHKGCRKRGRPKLRWEDCGRRDLRRLREDERWRRGGQ